MTETTEILEDLRSGNRSKIDRLTELVYAELHRLATKFMSGENANHVLQPTALVHEAFLRLADQDRVDWKSRSHFLAVGAQAMRRILVDHARGVNRLKRGADWSRVTYSEELAHRQGAHFDGLAVHDAIEKLKSLDELQARILELRYFAGMSVEEVACALDVSKRTVERQWTAARAWLRRELDDEESA